MILKPLSGEAMGSFGYASFKIIRPSISFKFNSNLIFGTHEFSFAKLESEFNEMIAPVNKCKSVTRGTICH